MKKRLNRLLAAAMTAFLVFSEAGNLPVVWAAEEAEEVDEVIEEDALEEADEEEAFSEEDDETEIVESEDADEAEEAKKEELIISDEDCEDICSNDEDSGETEETEEEYNECDDVVQTNVEEDRVVVPYNRDNLYAVGALTSGDKMCMAYSFAYAKTIMDGRVHNASEYWNGSYATWPAGWGRCDDASLKTIYDNINMNRPALLYVSGIYRDWCYKYGGATDHWVTVIGYKTTANRDALRESDFYVVDPADAWNGHKPTYTYLIDGCSCGLMNVTAQGSASGSSGSSGGTYAINNTGATNITSNTARINASVSPMAYVTETGFYLGTSPDYMEKHVEHYTGNTLSIWYDLGTGKWTGALQPGTRYYYKFYLISGGKVYESSVDSFVTGNPGDNGVVSNTGITGLDKTSVRINAELSEIRYCSEDGFYLGTSPDNMERHPEAVNGRIKTVWFDLGTGKWTGPLEKGTTYYYKLYVVTDGVEYATPLDSFTTLGDRVSPNISQAYITNLSPTGYTVVCEASDNVGIGRVSFPTWTAYNGQDDLAQNWYDSESAVENYGNLYYYNVYIAGHNYEKGKYITHVYAYDLDGNYVSVGLEVIIPEYVSGITLSNSTLEMKAGESYTLSATLSPATTTTSEVAWTSSNENGATVVNGKVTAVGPGTATITVQAQDPGGVSGYCTVTVKETEKHYKLYMNPNGGMFSDGTTIMKTAEPDLIYNGYNWHNISKYAVTREGYIFDGWYTKAEGGVKVYNADGTCITGEYWDGTKYIGASDLSVYAHWNKTSSGEDPLILEDTDPAEQYPLCPAPVITDKTTTIYMVKGQKFTMPDRGWISGDKRYVSVSDKGVVKAKKETYSPVILRKGDRVINVYVSDPGLEKSRTITTVKENQYELRLHYDAEHLNVLWFSDAQDVVRVSQKGEREPVAAGKAKVTAYINGKAYTCSVRVTEPTVCVERTRHITVGKPQKISIKGLRNPVWESSNTSVVTVYRNKMTAVATGSAYLSTVYNGVKYRIKVYVEDPYVTAAGLMNIGNNKYEMTMAAGTKAQLKYASLNQNVLYKSSKPEVAYVDEFGNVIARTPGKTKLTTKINGKTVKIVLNVV